MLATLDTATLGCATPAAQRIGATPVRLDLKRSREGRALSRFRYHNAESFFTSVEQPAPGEVHNHLYQIGIVQQLALSAHLLDVGISDQWCARHIGLDIARSLALANETGLDFSASGANELAALLSPYGKWRHADAVPQDLPIKLADMVTLTRALLDHIRSVTGHPRPTSRRSVR